MCFDKIKNEFDVRYYRWAIKDFRDEIAEDFPRLGKFKSGWGFWVMQMMSELSHKDQYLFAEALVKRSHANGLRLTGGAMTEDELFLCDKYGSLTYGLSPKEIEMREKQKPGTNIAMNRSLFIKVVNNKFKDTSPQQLGKRIGNLNWVANIGRWNIRTRIDTNLTLASVRYYHQIYSINKTIPSQNETLTVDSSMTLARLVSLNSWLGISSETSWFDLTEPEFQNVANQLANLITNFISAAPSLLDGL